MARNLHTRGLNLMARLADRIDAELQALYDQVPDVHCKGLCTDACGPIDGGIRERARMAHAGYPLPTADQRVAILRDAAVKGHTDDVPNCPALGDDGRCGAYDVRPMICRVWGASEPMPCPHGCIPDPGQRRLTEAETYALVDAARKAGTVERPVAADEVQRHIDGLPPHRRRQFDMLRKAAKPT